MAHKFQFALSWSEIERLFQYFTNLWNWDSAILIIRRYPMHFLSIEIESLLFCPVHTRNVCWPNTVQTLFHWWSMLHGVAKYGIKYVSSPSKRWCRRSHSVSKRENNCQPNNFWSRFQTFRVSTRLLSLKRLLWLNHNSQGKKRRRDTRKTSYRPSISAFIVF